MKKKNTNENRGVGRPRFEPRYPRALKWTMNDWCKANNKEAAKLTLIHNMARDSKLGNKSVIVRLKDTVAESRLGRKAYVYVLRSRIAEVTAAPKTTTPTARKTRTPKTDITVNVGLSQSTRDYEAQKAALLAPTPAVTIPVADVTSTPEPVTETAASAPEAVAAETVHQVAETATAEVTPVTFGSPESNDPLGS